MQNVNYLDGFVYHMTHVDNIRSIIQHKALFSKKTLQSKKIGIRSIAYDSVQNLRDRIFIWDFYERRRRNLHSYVPFYFSTYYPMLYVQLGNGMQNKLVIFKVSRSVLENQGVIFTDGNAANQCLSKSWNERVFIIPARGNDRDCTRIYEPNGPLGTSQWISKIFCDVKLLDRLDWDGINYLRPMEDRQESMRVRSAETLIPDSLAITEICGIAVGDRELEKIVNAIIDECDVTGMLPRAVHEPVLFSV